MVPVIRDAGRKNFAEFLDAYNALVEKARTNTLTADDLTGGNISLTNPGGIGTIASVPRLMVGQGTIVATGSIAYPPGLGAIGEAIGAEKVMTMTSTYDHRIIQGAESGRFLQRIEALLQGEDGFYERVFADLGVALGPLAPAPAARAITPPAGVPATTAARRRRRRGAAAGRAGRHLAAQGAPHPRPPRRQARSARPGARGRSGARPGAARAHARADGADPGADPADVRRRPDARRRAPASARDLLRADRLRDRAHRLASPAPVAARGDRVGQVPRPARDRRAEDAAPAAHRGRRARAVHAQGVPRAEAVLDRGTRHDRADARRADPARGDARRARGRDRDGPPRPAERTRAQPRPSVRLDLRRVRGLLDARADHHDPAGRHRRRQVPPRRPGLLPAPERRVDHRPARVEPDPPRVRGAGRGRGDARRPDHAPGPARPPRDERGRAGDPPRRRGVPGPGRGRRDAQPAGARRLHGRRDDPHHPEQPGRVHDRSGRLALDHVGVGSGQGLRRADHPRQRRRRAGVHQRGPAGVRVPPGVRARRADRPDRLPPVRSQRGGRARLHAARDVPGDQEAPAGARAVRAAADRAGRRDRAGVDRADRPGLGGPGRGAPAAQGQDRRRQGASSTRPASTSSIARPRPRSRRRYRPIACGC